MAETINDNAQNRLFREAHTYNQWQDKPVEHETLHQVYDLLKYAPTSANCSPLRVVFVRSHDAKQTLRSALAEGNIDKTMSAPVVAILAKDMEFYEHLPRLFPHVDARSWFAGNMEAIEFAATQNANLQAAYFIMAARAVGLDCGPMAGFDKDKVDELFFNGTTHRSIMLVNLGYGVPGGHYPRAPRFDFDDVVQFI